MSNENDSEDPAGLEEPSFASYESRGTPPHYHDVLSSADFGDAGYPFGVNPAILGPDHFVTNIPDPNLCQTLCTKDGPINTLRKNSRGEKHKRIFQACTRCRDRKAKCDGTQPVCMACRLRGAECVYAGRRMRGPSKKRLLEDADFSARRRRGAAGITVPEQQVPSYSPQAIEQSTTIFGETILFPPHYGVFPKSASYSSPHPITPPPLHGCCSPQVTGASDHIHSTQSPFRTPEGVNLNAYQSNSTRQVAPPNMIPQDMSALTGEFCTQALAWPGYTPEGATGVNASFNQANSNRHGEDGMHNTQSNQGDIQFVQFMPPNADGAQAPGEASQAVITRDEFNGLMESYITSLARKNREKALMSLARYSDILRILEDEAANRSSAGAKRKHSAGTKVVGSAEDITGGASSALLSPPSHTHTFAGDSTSGSPMLSNVAITIPEQLGAPNADTTDETTSNSNSNGARQSSQFRAWARKNFALQRIGSVSFVTHNKKRVAVQEQLYDILVHCHGQTNHGGRDKTNAMVNKYYSYVPKVFIESFVKACPGCPRKLTGVKRTATVLPLVGNI